MDEPGAPPRWSLIAALVLAIASVVVVLTLAALRHTPAAPLAIPAVPAPQAHDPHCRDLMAVLPSELGDFSRAQVREPAPEATAAWRSNPAGEPVVLRCGLDRPPEFVVGSPIQQVGAVQWFAVRADDRATWYTVDRPVYVALTLPSGSGPTPIQEISQAIADTIAAVPIDPAPVR